METINDLVAKMAHYDIPDYMRQSLAGYILNGHQVGGFLAALLSNDLKKTFNDADDQNALVVGGYMKFLYNQAPAACWGSEKNFVGWREVGGLTGYLSAIQNRSRS